MSTYRPTEYSRKEIRCYTKSRPTERSIMNVSRKDKIRRPLMKKNTGEDKAKDKVASMKRQYASGSK